MVAFDIEQAIRSDVAASPVAPPDGLVVLTTIEGASVRHFGARLKMAPDFSVHTEAVLRDISLEVVKSLRILNVTYFAAAYAQVEHRYGKALERVHSNPQIRRPTLESLASTGALGKFPVNRLPR